MGARIPQEAPAQEAAPAEGGQDQFGELVNNVISGIGTVMQIIEAQGGDPSGIAQVAQAFQQEITGFAQQAGGGGGQVPANPSQGVPVGPQG